MRPSRATGAGTTELSVVGGGTDFLDRGRIIRLTTESSELHGN